MAVEQTEIEKMAERVAEKTLNRVTSMLAFKAAGMNAETVRSLGRAIAADSLSLSTASGDAEYDSAAIEAAQNAIVAVFDTVASSMAAQDTDETETA